jgi:hypothetical protein
MLRRSILDLLPDWALNHLKGYPPPLRIVVRAKIGSLLSLLIGPLVPEKVAMSGDPLKADIALKAP